MGRHIAQRPHAGRGRGRGTRAVRWRHRRLRERLRHHAALLRQRLAFLQEVLRQVRARDRVRALSQQRRRAQHVGQLAQVARPGVGGEQRHHLGRHRYGAVCGGRVMLGAQQPLHDHRQVRALAQRRQSHHQAVQSIVQVVTELAVGHHGAQVAVRGADHVHVHLDLSRAAQRRHAALLQHAQQPRLHGQRHVANLVQEQRATVRLHDLAHAALAPRAGEGALFVAEQLGLDQRLGNGRAVHRHEGPPRARAVVMDGTRQQLLAGARLTQDHRGHATPQQPRDALDHLRQLGIARVQVAQAGQAGGRGGPCARRRGLGWAVRAHWQRDAAAWRKFHLCVHRHACRQLQRKQRGHRAARMLQQRAHRQAEQRGEGVCRQRRSRQPQLELRAAVGRQKAPLRGERRQPFHERAQELRARMKAQAHGILVHLAEEVVLHHRGGHAHQRQRVGAVAAAVAAHVQRAEDLPLRVQDGSA